MRRRRPRRGAITCAGTPLSSLTLFKGSSNRRCGLRESRRGRQRCRESAVYSCANYDVLSQLDGAHGKRAPPETSCSLTKKLPVCKENLRFTMQSSAFMPAFR
eukprot:4624240-Pleurochrysis_carterae.AAC.2